MTQDAARAKVKAFCREHGAILRNDKIGIHAEIRIEAPALQVFSGRDVHEIIVATFTTFDWCSAWEQCCSAGGFEPCTIDDCEWCADTKAGISGE